MEPMSPAGVLPHGTPVEVRNRFVGTWTGRFEVAEASEAGYRLRRVFDGQMLAGEFPHDDVRRHEEARRWHPSVWRGGRRYPRSA